MAVEAPILVDKIISDLERVIKITKKLCLTYTFLYAMLLQGFPSLRSKWFFLTHKSKSPLNLPILLGSKRKILSK
jgi:hypothetical protein